MPDPSLDQASPFHLAMLFVPCSPAVLNVPAAKSDAPPPSSKTSMARTAPLVPFCSGDQLMPFHREMLLDASLPPAAVNSPPAYRASPAPSSKVRRHSTSVPTTPPLTSDQAAPSHLAMRFTETSPA